MKLFARGHPEGRWFKCRHSFLRPRHGWELNFTQNSPPLASSPWAISSQQPRTNLRRLLAARVRSHTVKNTLRMPFLNSDPASRCCRQPRSGTCPAGSPGTDTAWAVQGRGSCCLGSEFSSPRIKDFHFWGAADFIAKLKQGAQFLKLPSSKRCLRCPAPSEMQPGFQQLQQNVSSPPGQSQNVASGSCPCQGMLDG